MYVYISNELCNVFNVFINFINNYPRNMPYKMQSLFACLLVFVVATESLKWEKYRLNFSNFCLSTVIEFNNNACFIIPNRFAAREIELWRAYSLSNSS